VTDDSRKDQRWLAALYEAHGRALLAYATALVNDRATGEDLLHQVFARLLSGGIGITGPPLPYLCRAVRNAAFNRKRDRARETALEGHDAWLEAPSGLEEIALTIESAMRHLPDEQREVMALRVWGEMTFEEIARTLGISPNTVASRYRYGLAKLRAVLKPEERT
jgi:RNA polymerase sigma-70 factor (ECF subfamily)